jgi:homoserine O-succinyltransferase
MSQEDEANEALVIGLVNNMPDGALKATERQFRDLLTVAAADTCWQLRLFSLPDPARGESSQAYLRENYEPFEALWTSRFDGLIVTGTEPRTPVLSEEPYWNTLAKLIDWADTHVPSTVWSCLAAHAAVLHLDGIERQRLPQKLSGVFECARHGDHPLLEGAPARWGIPHSRLNDLPPQALTDAGYEILSLSATAGADLFIRSGRSLFVFLQGHPEYDPDSLLREYHRDIGRYLRGERSDYPQMPQGYFTPEVAEALTTYRKHAMSRRSIDALASFPTVDLQGESGHPWHAQARRLYANWFAWLARKRRQTRGRAL